MNHKNCKCIFFHHGTVLNKTCDKVIANCFCDLDEMEEDKPCTSDGCRYYSRGVEEEGNRGGQMNLDNLIQWPRAKYWDKAWNPVVGCKPCSPACENCYAAAWAKRFGQSFEPHLTSNIDPPRSGIVFCGNMTDLFGGWSWPLHELRGSCLIKMSNDLIARACGKTHNEAIYLWLTKRVGTMIDAIRRAYLNHEPIGNHYFGFTGENQEWYDRRRESIYYKWPERANLWLSCEPLLGAIDDMKIGNVVAGSRLKWVVVGCESGPNRRPCKIEWVESIVDQCRSAGVPVFVKQLDIGGKCEHDIDKFPAHLRIRQVPWAEKVGVQ